MAHYQYNGLHFELPDGMSNEQALSKIKAHLGETEAKKQEPSIGDKLIAGTKQMAASAVNTMDTGVSLAASLPARMFQGQEAQEEIFKNLNTRTASRNWGEGVDPGVMGKVAGAVVTLPAQMLAMGLSPAQTGKTALDLGESLPTALKAAGIDAAGNAVGMLLPGAVGVSKAAKVASGAGINAAQEALTKVGIQGLMQTEQGKKTFAPTLEDTLVSGIVGGGFGAMHKTKAPKTSPGKKDIKGAVAKEAAFAKPSDGMLGKELPGEVDVSYMQQRRAAEEQLRLVEEAQQRALSEEHQASLVQKKAELDGILARLDEEHQQSLKQVDAEQFAAAREPVQDMTGLSTGEGMSAVRDPSRAPVVDSGLLGLPEGPKTGPVGLSTGEQGVASPATNKSPMGPSNLFGEPVREQAVPGIPDALRAGEGGVASPATNAKTPTDPYGQMGAAGGLKDTRPRIDPVLAAGETGVARPAQNVKPATPNAPLDPFAGAAGAGNKRINKFGQGGSAPMFNDLAEGIVSLGKGIKARFTGEKTAVPDSVINPTSTDNIAKKQRMADRHEALGIKDSVYRNVSTVEEATTNPGKDIGKHQELASGTEGVIRRNKTNKPINFIRTMEVKARWAADALIRQHITGTDGLNRVIAKLSKVEQLEIAELITELSNRKVDYSSRIAEELSLSPAQRAFMERRASSFQAVKSLMDEYNAKNGFELVESLNGYAPSLFSSQYASPVYKVVKDSAGNEHRTIVGVANGRSLAEWELAKKYFDEKGFTVEPYKRRGLKTKAGYDREFDGTLQMLREMAEQDPRFAELQQGLEVVQRESAKKLYGLNVHEMHKKGVEGAVGQKPWRSAEQNAKERLEAEINYLDQAFKYWSYQDFITQSKTLVDNPALADMKNTREYINDHVKQVTGVDLNPIGTFSNSIVDLAFKYVVPKSMPENPQRVASAVRDTFSAIAMNIYAPLYATVNLLQPFTGGLPEALRIRAAAGLNPQDVLTSLSNAAVMRTVISSLDLFNIDPTKTKIPAHLIEAQRFMKKHAMESFNEAQMSHEGAQNPKLQRVKQGAFWPTIIPEMATRPTVFMWYVDMFHKAGLKGEDLMMTAYNASEHAMVGYHPDQRPMLYSQMGMYGTMTGQLKTFGHNAIENLISRTKEAKEYPAAYLAMMSMLVGLGGISGLPGFENLDEWVIQPLTGKSALRHLQEVPSWALHGLASDYSGLDWQSRFSMAGTIPTDLKDLMGASVSKMIDIGSAGVDFIKNNDTGSFNALMKATIPSGAYGAYEDQQLTTQDGFVLDKEGQIKYDQPRTERERKVRAVWGLRPLRERLEDADLYARDREWAKMTEKEKKQATLMKRALNFRDDEGFWNAYTKYKELGGDPTLVQNMFEQNAVQANMDARTRRSGVPSDSIKSIKKYQHYTEE